MGNYTINKKETDQFTVLWREIMKTVKQEIRIMCLLLLNSHTLRQIQGNGGKACSKQGDVKNEYKILHGYKY
jgi:hypothetical protein